MYNTSERAFIFERTHEIKFELQNKVGLTSYHHKTDTTTSTISHKHRILLKFVSILDKFNQLAVHLAHVSGTKSKQESSITFSIPRMCIFAIISAVKRKVTIRSEQNVTYCRGGYFSNVLGVFRLTDNRLTNAQNLIRRRTQSWNIVTGPVSNDHHNKLHTDQHIHLQFQLVN